MNDAASAERRAATGDVAAFGALVRQHQSSVRGFLRRLTKGDAALADDLAQETFLAAWSRIERLKTGASVRAWLCGIGYNKHLSAVRSGSRDRVRDASYEADREAVLEADVADRMALEAAMSELPPEQRACVALCLAADFSHAEASEALSLPLGTVKSHVTRGRARLLQALGGPDGQ